MSSYLEFDESSLVRARAALATFQEPNMTKVMRAAALAGARVLRAPLRAETPIKGRTGAGAGGFFTTRGGARSSYGNPGDMRNSIRVAYSRDSATRKGIAYIVGPIGKKAFMRYWVTGGTKPHTIYGKVGHPMSLPWGPRRFVNHPGARANPFVQRVGERFAPAVAAAMVASIAKQQARRF